MGRKTALKWLRMTLRVKGPGKALHLSRSKDLWKERPTTNSYPINKIQIRVILVPSLTFKAYALALQPLSTFCFASQKRCYLTHYVLCWIPISRSGNLELFTLDSAPSKLLSLTDPTLPIRGKMGGWLSSAISDRMLAVSGSASLALLDGGSWLAFPACENQSSFPPSSWTRRFRGRWKRREYGFGTASNAFPRLLRFDRIRQRKVLDNGRTNWLTFLRRFSLTDLIQQSWHHNTNHSYPG